MFETRVVYFGSVMRNICFQWIVLQLTLSSLLFADKGTIETDKPKQLVPWFTGPLICPAPNVVSEGHYNIEPYLFVVNTSSLYNNDWHTSSIPSQWKTQLFVPIWVGLTDWCDVMFQPTTSWTHKKGGGGAWSLGDLLLQFEFQIWHEQLPYESWIPSIKLSIGEIIPMGKYRNLNPHKLGADQGGLGTWSTSIALVFGRIFHFQSNHFLSWRFSAGYVIYNSPVHVKGYHAYGGGRGANGRVFPGRNLQLDMSFEYSLTRNWALALDLIGYWKDKANFTGNPGTDLPLDTRTVIAKSAGIAYSLAPAIEYNWNENLGVIAGAWFTVAGKQTSDFFTFVFAVNYYK